MLRHLQARENPSCYRPHALPPLTHAGWSSMRTTLLWHMHTICIQTFPDTHIPRYSRGHSALCLPKSRVQSRTSPEHTSPYPLGRFQCRSFRSKKWKWKHAAMPGLHALLFALYSYCFCMHNLLLCRWNGRVLNTNTGSNRSFRASTKSKTASHISIWSVWCFVLASSLPLILLYWWSVLIVPVPVENPRPSEIKYRATSTLPCVCVLQQCTMFQAQYLTAKLAFVVSEVFFIKHWMWLIVGWVMDSFP